MDERERKPKHKGTHRNIDIRELANLIRTAASGMATIASRGNTYMRESTAK